MLCAGLRDNVAVGIEEESTRALRSGVQGEDQVGDRSFRGLVSHRNQTIAASADTDLRTLRLFPGNGLQSAAASIRLRTVKHIVLLLLLLAASSVVGCAPCSERCSNQAAVFERCLHRWDLEWADLGVIDEADFRDTCRDGLQVYLDSLDEEGAAVESQRCSALNSELSGEPDCDAAWQSLVNYGVEP